MRRAIPITAAAVLAFLVVAGTASNLVLATVLGCIGAALVAAAVTVEYLVLVPLSHNPGAKRLVGLLVAVDLLLGATILRYFVRDFPLRNEIQAWLFWGLVFALAYLGWHIWKDQLEGARKYRRQQETAEAREDHR